MKILVETSARHIHLSRSDFEVLFGCGAGLVAQKELSQPGEIGQVEYLISGSLSSFLL